ncbi:Acetyl xylan esterase [Rhodopirellula maiorica SM1]|uniref:Acetyl xylan esterase n=2 Tax=Novipirellula TaxID=2795426 RepID=M5S3D5_9BACT|nr:Acetyl xylan esterase [Rhodopirellula maiorica SM1]
MVVDTSHGDQLVNEYFRSETEKISSAVFADIKTLDDWQDRRQGYRDQLYEMLGLSPLPERTPLSPVITGSATEGDVVVENIHFQSMPGLYVTGNLYRPAKQDGPLPAILYVCGHGKVKKDGISYGNKTYYQYHGAWFARNGYVCLTIDTIQLGEIEGIHHGTYREGAWWWNNRGYTPAGVEAWNGIRALDYLQSRPEVDGQRIGVTGRSGGGAYSWYIAALDERIKVAVPVAGITSLKNHVVDGCVEGHCDCMYMVNTYRWDYPMVAALIAPRPLLISNTDKDSIFPLDGVVDVYSKVRSIYKLYENESHVGLHITEGPHSDSQELRIHAFRWFNRHLRSDNELINKTATPFFDIKQLKVFDSLPTDERVSTIHETFVPKWNSNPSTRPGRPKSAQHDELIQSLKRKTFGGWPQTAGSLDTKTIAEREADGMKVKAIQFTSQSPYRLTMFAVTPMSSAPPKMVNVVVLDQQAWQRVASGLAVVMPERFRGVTPDKQIWEQLRDESPTVPTVYVTPRGVGFTEWTRDPVRRTHIRRRFMLLGQTAAGMQIYDVVQALKAIGTLPSFESAEWRLRGSGDAAAWSLLASLFNDRIVEMSLIDLPVNNRDAPDLLNISKFTEIPQIAWTAADRVQTMQIGGSNIEQWKDEFSQIKKEDLSIIFCDDSVNGR